MAGLERISSITGETTARRLMIVDLTLRVNPARAHTRVLALVVDAGLGVRAVRILDALRPAALIRLAGVARQAGA